MNRPCGLGIVHWAFSIPGQDHRMPNAHPSLRRAGFVVVRADNAVDLAGG
jgi:hypothetical protein